MKRIELTDVSSNLLLASSIFLAVLPLVMGDHLVLFVSDGIRQLGVLSDQFSAYLSYLLS